MAEQELPEADAQDRIFAANDNGLKNDDQYTTNTPAEPQDFASTVRFATDRVLTFLSTASNETLGACIAGLGATTYIVLGRVGLLLIGAVGGIVLHASWEGKSQGQGDKLKESIRRQEIGLEVAKRVLDWRRSQTQDAAASTEESTSAVSQADFSRFPPETAKAMNILTDAVIRDYVNWWYAPVLPTESTFPAVSRQTFSTFLLGISNNIARKRPADMLLEFTTNSSSIMIVFLNELATAVWATPSKPINASIEAYFALKPESSLATIISEQQQEQKLLVIADDILSNYLGKSVYDCPPARTFLRQILAKVVIDFSLQRCSESDWINEWIVFLLDDAQGGKANAVVAEVSDRSTKTATTPDELNAKQRQAEHQRTVSRAEEAMEDAMREAQRLTKLMAEEDAKQGTEQAPGQTEQLAEKLPVQAAEQTSEQQPATASDGSGSVTQEITTPTSSQSHSPKGSITREAPNDDGSKSESLPIDANVAASSLQAPFEAEPLKPKESLTLHKAQVSIFDDALPGEKKVLKTRPNTDYMIQIEPPSSSFTGWMIARTYNDFEILHEVLRRISTISGATGFSEVHGQLPIWRNRTKPQLTQDLELYLVDALKFEPLAESEGMKRFLEKERGMSKSPKGTKGFWAGPEVLGNMGKGVFDAIAKAPKGVAGGGKAMFSNVAGVLGGPQRTATLPKSPTGSSLHVASRSTTTLSSDPRTSTASDPRTSLDSPRPSSSDYQVLTHDDVPAAEGAEREREAKTAEAKLQETVEPIFNLPPPPSDIPDDYRTTHASAPAAPAAPAEPKLAPKETPAPEEPVPAEPKKRQGHAPISEQEAQVAIELVFAVVNELYTLSSAWSLRRTLLNAARSYLLRPGNPQLESIRQLIQESVLDANSTDAAMAALILKLRENSLPTPAELESWPAPRSDAEKAALCIKARHLAKTRAVPQALTSVMGAAASAEAVGRVFDALQDARVAKGLLFGVALQALRALVQ